ncbi:hypothetical protein MRB53_040896 [Persea americana]|nr:hypothetical protein MRB53_040896 [Persea americana]
MICDGSQVFKFMHIHGKISEGGVPVLYQHTTLFTQSRDVDSVAQMKIQIGVTTVRAMNIDTESVDYCVENLNQDDQLAQAYSKVVL